jgi:hypothetical protein
MRRTELQARTVNGNAVKSILTCALVATSTVSHAADGVANAGFPRLMGMNIGAKNYEDPRYQEELSRLHVVILGFYAGWQPPGYAPTPTLAIRKALKAIKARNPAVLVGQYTVLNEAYDDPGDGATLDVREKLNAADWWLRNGAGRKVQWTARYSTWEINFTEWTRPDSAGRRWPQWLAERNYEVFFRDIPEFDIVYLDNVMVRSRVKGDWNVDGKDDHAGDPTIHAAHRAGHLAYWRRIRELLPEALLIGNSDGDLANPEWRKQLEGAFLEGLMGERWSIESWDGWPAMMARYRAVLANTGPPNIVGFNVHGAARDYRFFRYAFTSCLLDDGYFSFTDKAREHSSVPWFDEYDHRLGAALSAPPTAPWRAGVWRRDFAHGVVLVNPTSETRTIAIEPGLRRLAGRQDPAVNDGSIAKQVTLRSKDGIVLRR